MTAAIQEVNYNRDGRCKQIPYARRVPLRAGQAVVNPPGVWHTADVTGEATALFITPGLDTDHRPR